MKKLVKNLKEGPKRLWEFIQQHICFILSSSIIVAALIWFFGTMHLTDEIQDVHAIALILLTFFLVWVAYVQLKTLNKTSKSDYKTSRSDFLLRIDERYSSPKILEARQLLREMYCKTATKLGKNANAIDIENLNSYNKCITFVCG